MVKEPPKPRMFVLKAPRGEFLIELVPASEKKSETKVHVVINGVKGYGGKTFEEREALRFLEKIKKKEKVQLIDVDRNERGSKDTKGKKAGI